MNEIVEWVEDDERWEQENTWWMGNVGPAHLQLQSDVGHNNDPNNLNKSKCAPTPWYYYASTVLILRNVWKQQREEKARQAKAKLVSQKNGAWRPLGGDIDGGGSASAPKLAHASTHTNQYTHAPTMISQSSSTGPFFIHPPLLISHLFFLSPFHFWLLQFVKIDFAVFYQVVSQTYTYVEWVYKPRFH